MQQRRTPSRPGGAPSSASSSTSGASVGETVRLPRSALIARILRSELDALFTLQRWRRLLPLSLRALCEQLLSTHPFYDLSVALWLILPLELLYHGWSLFWLLSFNLYLGFFLAWVLGGHIPGEVDVRLRPRGRVSPSGFPCIELQLCSCLLLFLAMRTGSAAEVAAVACYLAALLLLRLYGLTHFPHQLLGSLALGGGSVPALLAWARWAFRYRVHEQAHILSSVLVVGVAIGVVAYQAESNSAPFLRIPKEECECSQT